MSFPVFLKSWPKFRWTSAFLSRVSSDLTLGFHQLLLNVNAFILLYPKHRCVSSQVGLVTQETILGLQVTENGHIWPCKLDNQDVKPNGSRQGQRDSKVMDLIIHDILRWCSGEFCWKWGCLQLFLVSEGYSRVLYCKWFWREAMVQINDTLVHFTSFRSQWADWKDRSLQCNCDGS